MRWFRNGTGLGLFGRKQIIAKSLKLEDWLTDRAWGWFDGVVDDMRLKNRSIR